MEILKIVFFGEMHSSDRKSVQDHCASIKSYLLPSCGAVGDYSKHRRQYVSRKSKYPNVYTSAQCLFSINLEKKMEKAGKFFRALSRHELR